MGIKLKPPYDIDWTPVYRTLDEDGILGLANKNGTIRVHKDIQDPAQMKEVLDHEKVHLKDMKNGLLWYDDEYMYTRENTKTPFKKIKRSAAADGNPKHSHEKRAYKTSKRKNK